MTLAAALTLAGCASFTGDGGFDDVGAMTRERVGVAVSKTNAEQSAQTAVRVEQLLAAPLAVDAAVEIALLNNRALQADLAELGIAEAEFVQTGRLRNPGFSFSRLRTGEDVEIERSVGFDLAGLLTLPVRTRIAGQRFEFAKLSAAAQSVRHAHETRRAYFNAIAAAQQAAYLRTAQESAEAGAALAQRMAQVGNWSKLDQSRQQAFYGEITAQLARSEQQTLAARERLTRLLGLWGQQAGYKLPDRLPELPAAPREVRDVEAQALNGRLDVLAARRELDAMGRALGLTQGTRFINVLDAGYHNVSETGHPRGNGYEVSLEVPLFDWGGARVASARARYSQAVDRLANVAVSSRSQAREAHAGYRSAYDVAKHYRDELVPLRRRISDEVLLRYNGMLVSVFELLADAREQVGVVSDAIAAQRDFWIADTDLNAALTGSGSVPRAAEAPSAPAAAPQGH
jgi:outer membrane protein TolC